MPRRKNYRKRLDPRTGKQRSLHRLVMAEILGRPLHRQEVVHHRNGDPTDNRAENLIVMPNQAWHAHIEHLLRRERHGQPLLFPELLTTVHREPAGTLFDHVLPVPSVH